MVPERIKTDRYEHRDMYYTPDRIAIPTAKPYDMALTENNGPAGVHTLIPRMDEKIETRNGQLKAGNLDLTHTDLSKQYEKPEDRGYSTDIRLLDTLYTLVLFEYWKDSTETYNSGLKKLEDPVTIRFRSLNRMGIKERSLHSDEAENFRARLERLGKLVGTIRDERHITNLPVLSTLGFNEKKTMFTFQSPYMAEIAKRVVETSKTEKRHAYDVPKGYSYIIRPSAAFRRSENAYEVVRAAVIRINRSKRHSVTIRPAEIMKECPDMQTDLLHAETTAGKNAIIRRAFQTGWEMLQTETSLTEDYENIVLPDPKENASMMTAKQIKNIEYTVTYVSHRPEPEEMYASSMHADGWKYVSDR